MFLPRCSVCADRLPIASGGDVTFTTKEQDSVVLYTETLSYNYNCDYSKDGEFASTNMSVRAQRLASG